MFCFSFPPPHSPRTFLTRTRFLGIHRQFLFYFFRVAEAISIVSSPFKRLKMKTKKFPFFWDTRKEINCLYRSFGFPNRRSGVSEAKAFFPRTYTRNIFRGFREKEKAHITPINTRTHTPAITKHRKP